MTTKYIRRAISTLAYLLLILSLSAQGLKIGQPVPDITFTRLINTEQKELSLNSLKGKNVILYSWATYCAPCIEKFPLYNKLRDKYKEDLEIILLSGDEYTRVVRIFDNQRSIGRNVTLTQVILSKEDYAKLDISKEYNGFSGGYTWIDKEGNYQGATEINDENIVYFIKNGTLKTQGVLNYAPVVRNFQPVNDTIRQENFKALKEYDPKKPLLFGQEGKNIRSGSVFTDYNPYYPDLSPSPIIVVMKNDKPIGIRYINKSHSLTYEAANILEYQIDKETHALKPIKYRKIKNSFTKPETNRTMSTTLFNGDSLLYAKGICYELMLPEDTVTDIPTLLAYMRNDLDRYFGLNSKIEMRKCLALVEIEKGKTDLKSRYKNPSTQRDNFGVSIRNEKIDYLTSAVNYYYLLLGKGDIEYAYILDHTNIDYNIDVDIVAEMTNLSSIKKALNKVGLDLIETEAIGEVCVISDH